MWLGILVWITFFFVIKHHNSINAIYLAKECEVSKYFHHCFSSLINTMNYNIYSSILTNIINTWLWGLILMIVTFSCQVCFRIIALIFIDTTSLCFLLCNVWDRWGHVERQHVINLYQVWYSFVNIFWIILILYAWKHENCSSISLLPSQPCQ